MTFKKVAIVHEWFATYAGSERVVEQLLNLFPDADLFALVDFLPPGERGFIQNKPVKTSFLQRMPKAKTHFRHYLPLMPLAVEQFDLSGYDLVLSSSHAVAKGVITGPDTLHVCYCYSPIRYAWDLTHEYLREAGLDRGIKGVLARRMLHRIRVWDALSSQRVDHFVTLSHFIARRIHKVYRRPSTVIFPPVDVTGFPMVAEKGASYVAASRMVPYKRMPLIAEAFAKMPDRQLVMIGDGTDLPRVRDIAAKAPNITVMGYQPTPVLRDHLQRARALVFAALEDFGILPVEAMACGTPVIAFGQGGALDTVRGLDDTNPTGVFFAEQSVEAIIAAVDRFEAERHRITPDNCREQAERFDIPHFQAAMREYLEKLITPHENR